MTKTSVYNIVLNKQSILVLIPEINSNILI
jgi:hypothetical protein